MVANVVRAPGLYVQLARTHRYDTSRRTDDFRIGIVLAKRRTPDVRAVDIPDQTAPFVRHDGGQNLVPSIGPDGAESEAERNERPQQRLVL